MNDVNNLRINMICSSCGKPTNFILLHKISRKQCPLCKDCIDNELYNKDIFTVIERYDTNVRIGSIVKKKKCYWMTDEMIDINDGKICEVTAFNDFGHALFKGILELCDKVPCDPRNYDVIKY